MSEQTTEKKTDGRTGPRKKPAGVNGTGPKTGRGPDGDGFIVIKKYANRRLYNTATSSYVTLDFLSELVKAGQDFVVFDAKSGDDITRTVLTQIIFEQENKGQNLLPVQFLRQLIKFYGDSMQSYVPSYLEMSMDSFARNQEELRQQLDQTLGQNPGYKLFEDSVRKNMAMYEQAMKMFSSSIPGMQGFSGMGAPFTPPAPGQGDTGEETVDDVKRELEALKAKLARMEAD
ncbi:MAG: polyhydroxyalkanoate synthesis repressor PhaR [Pseudomonadota bacterium]